MDHFSLLIFLLSLLSKSVAVRSRFRLVDNPYDIDHTADNFYNNTGNRRLAKNTASKDVSAILFQKCKDSGEAYSASYLISKEHLQYQFTGYNLTWVNCEMGSFIMMNGKANPDKDVNGSMLQSVDVLDFSVVHLSTYERLLRRWGKSVASDPAAKAGNIDPIYHSAALLKTRALTLRDPLTPIAHTAYNRTVVVMPFLASDMGAGHSKLSNRLQYLSACFWSFYAVYPHVVAAVKNEKDRDFARWETTSLDLMRLIANTSSFQKPVGPAVLRRDAYPRPAQERLAARSYRTGDKATNDREQRLMGSLI
jgi:hypothetical protein